MHAGDRGPKTYKGMELIPASNGLHVKNGPLCGCGHRGWIGKKNRFYCSICGCKFAGHVKDIIVDGPECGCGNRDWFVESN